MNTTDRRTLALLAAAVLALLGLAAWGGACMGASRVWKQYDELEVQLASASRQVKSVQADLAQLQSKSDSQQKDNDALRAQVELVQANLSQAQSASASRQKDNDALRTQLQSVQADLSQVQSAAASQQKDNEAMRAQLESVKADLAREQSRIATLQQTNAALRTQLGSAETELSQMQSRYGSLQDSNAALRTQLASAQAQISQAQSSRISLQQENATLRVQLESWYAWLRNSPPPPTPPTLTAGPSLTLSPVSGPMGTAMTIAGSGFAANTSGNVFLDINRNGAVDPGEPFQYLTTSANGAFSTTLTVPSSPPVPAGAYSALARFPVGAAAPAAATFTVT